MDGGLLDCWLGDFDVLQSFLEWVGGHRVVHDKLHPSVVVEVPNVRLASISIALLP